MLRISSLLRNASQTSKALQAASVRHLNLHEYQSKQLMADGGVTVQRFKVADTSAQARDIAQSVKYDEFVVKAQVLAGGRGKGTFDSGLHGGVKLTRDPAQVVEFVEKMLGYRLVTKQTPKEGVLVKKVMIAEALDIKRETYLAILMDRTFNGPVVVASPAGGVDIEEVAEKTPELIFKQPVDINKGLTDEQAMSIAKNLQFEGNNMKDAAEQIKKLYQVFRRVDATMVEINPFGETPDGKVVCFDAKINFDDNAQFRQKDIFAQEDHAESDPREVEAAKWNLNYIGMDGNIACLVNGAGLAMATMDIIKLHGGNPANFLDVGGSVGEEQVAEAFRILTQDPKVKAILVNVFGGIVNCATIANGIVNACKKISLSVPLVVRLEGTNVDAAKEILSNSGLPIHSANDLDDAAIKAVASLRG
ncbi:succinate--CoA ligase [GDP-forming] subunit beta, mitochondrial [Galendromus occidentalis]|uniref:Succinate--CoA ligase [GDP-forming] subunit beta, mitochondrial n=1 Tax=Galendromus occidentalis TaxID=34638 RepID=A0AAJ6VZS7_9ACAR|nr:succinate--CoA ligase [GDP-forming] subunit beta, mitochondrial [Galendromus occidentalis]